MQNDLKCIYCNTIANNATSKKGLYVCCCYQLQKIGNSYTQYTKDGKEIYYRDTQQGVVKVEIEGE